MNASANTENELRALAGFGEKMENNSVTTSSKLLKWFSNPLVGIIGSVASVIGIILSIYFYLASSKSPDLTFCLHPIRSTILSKEVGQDLTFFFRGKKVESEISVARFAIWNRGSSSIKPENVLSSVGIQIASDVEILKAKIVSVSREITKFQINETEITKGKILFSWKILERGDGAVVELIYASGSSSLIEPIGVVEGQGKLSQTSLYRTIKSANEQFSERPNYYLAYLYLPFFFYQAYSMWREKQLGFWGWIINLFIMLVIVLYGFVFYISWIEKWPGFAS